MACANCACDTFELHDYFRPGVVVAWRCSYCRAASDLPVPIQRDGLAWRARTRAGDSYRAPSSWETSLEIHERASVLPPPPKLPTRTTTRPFPGPVQGDPS